MIKAITIDDEKNCTDVLDWMLTTYCPNVQILAACNSAHEGVEAIKKYQPDVVFLDIEMPRMNGFELLQQFQTVNFDVIFTTAYNQFAIKAFKVCAIDYLLKPIDPDELQLAVAKVDQKTKNLSKQQLELLLQNIKLTTKMPLNRVALSTQNGLEFFVIDEIVRCQSDSNYTVIHFTNQSSLLVSKSLKDIENILTDYQFYRIHASHLVNAAYIKKYVKGDGGYVVLSNGEQISVSRNKKEDFIRFLNA